jgi:hypothetical protein
VKPKAADFRVIGIFICVAALGCTSFEPKYSHEQYLDELKSQLEGVVLDDGINADEARIIAENYFVRIINVEGAIGPVTLQGQFWDARFATGALGIPNPNPIKIDRRTGMVSWQGGPTIEDPKQIWSLAFVEVITLPREAREQLFASATKVQILRSIKDLPAAVTQACESIAFQHDFRMANPGEKFEPGDAIVDPNLPERRLRWAARLPNYYLFHYEHGGRGLHQHIVLVSYSDAKNVKVVWSGFSPPLKDYKEFLEALRAGKLSDSKAGEFQESWHL